MPGKYIFIEHTADIAVDVEGETFEDLFEASAAAWKEAILEEVSLSDKEERTIDLLENSIEELLVSFLNEINFLLQVKKWITNSIKSIEILPEENGISLKAAVSGELFNDDKHLLKEEIKSVTYHQMEIKKINQHYMTRIVFDI